MDEYDMLDSENADKWILGHLMEDDILPNIFLAKLVAQADDDSDNNNKEPLM